MTTTCPFCVATGAWLYNHLATRKLPIAQPQTSTAMEDVRIRVGTRSMKPTPIQNSAKMAAAPRAKATVDSENVRKSTRGRNEKISCETMNDCVVRSRLASCDEGMREGEGLAEGRAYKENWPSRCEFCGLFVCALSRGRWNDSVKRSLSIVDETRSILTSNASVGVCGSGRHGLCITGSYVSLEGRIRVVGDYGETRCRWQKSGVERGRCND